MIVVDSSVWISHFAGVLHREVVDLRTTIDPEDVVVCDLVVLEVLRGARSEQAAGYMAHELGLFTFARLGGMRNSVAAAGHYRTLRRLGLTIRSPIDLLIGTYCIEHGHQLLQRDRDFGPMREHLGLRLA
ncbi:MAG: PIN domain-containing protein [Hyphomicrobiales bacterium]|nr:MAG: PIN domain-containing protein [Hyphomicrobiales bacterium]